MRVHKDEYARFSELQRDLGARNSEALAALYHMEHAPDRPVTFRVTSDADRNDRYDPTSNTIYWNPDTAVRDAFDGARVAPDTAALHEETHWAGRRVGDILANIPAGHWDNREEKRVIEGAESRDMHVLRRETRHSHFGTVLPVDRVNSISPALTVEQDGTKRHVHGPWRRSGHVMREDPPGTAVLAIRGDGSDPRDRISLSIEQVSWAMGGSVDGARALLDDARTHKDAVTFQITKDGRIVYSDSAQERRLHDHPQAGLTYPQPMRALHPLAVDPADGPAPELHAGLDVSPTSGRRVPDAKIWSPDLPFDQFEKMLSHVRGSIAPAAREPSLSRPVAEERGLER